MTREKMEELSKDLLERMMAPVTSAMSEAGMVPADIKAVELVGNASRMPFIPAQLKAFFGFECSRTLNASECVARGCALQGAMLSPQFKVRDFEVVDSFPFPVSFSWVADDGEAKDMEMFERNNAVPSLEDDDLLPQRDLRRPGQVHHPHAPAPRAPSPAVGAFESGPCPSARTRRARPSSRSRSASTSTASSPSSPRRRSRRSRRSRWLSRPRSSPPPRTAEGAAAAAPEGDDAPMETAAAPEPAAPVMKKRVIKTDVPVKSTVGGGLPAKVLDTFVAEEFEMALQDRVMEETKERKNAVEEYVYGTRAKLSDAARALRRARGGGEVPRRARGHGGLALRRGRGRDQGRVRREARGAQGDGRPHRAPRGGGERAVPRRARRSRASPPRSRRRPPPMPRTRTSTPQDLEKIAAECKAALDWLAEKTACRAGLAKTAPPVLLSADVVKKTEALKRVAEPILARPKPAPPKPEPTKVEEPMDTAEGDAAEPMDAEGGDAPVEGARPRRTISINGDVRDGRHFYGRRPSGGGSKGRGGTRRAIERRTPRGGLFRTPRDSN